MFRKLLEKLFGTSEQDEEQKIVEASCEDSFLKNVILSVYFMQTDEKHKNGVSITSIADFMRGFYKLNGDVEAMVKTRINQAVREGFLYKEKEKYAMMATLVCFAECDNVIKQKKDLEREIKNIYVFSPKPAEDDPTELIRNKREDADGNKKRKNSEETPVTKKFKKNK